MTIPSFPFESNFGTVYALSSSERNPPINKGVIYPNHILGFIKNGEFREPKKGEYYLSGAVPEAYIAPNDLSTKYHILNTVKIKTIVTYKVERV